ncbi:MAG TPA: peptide MFS transporter [Holophaga sp.]|nr:peptide MFS transporter [Holophaga sp.]
MSVETPSKGQPAGLWVLIFTETWERFSHYGMRALLIIYLTTPVALGGLGLDKFRAGGLFGGYMLSIYLFSLNGGQIADRFLGAKRTIVLGGLLIAAGQIMLQIKSLNGVIGSLVFIAIGTCLLKPNISASVGRLYGKDDPRRDGAFTIEYMGINTGAFLAPLVCGTMAEHPRFHAFLNSIGLNSSAGWSWAFAVSGFGMLLGLANFMLRRHLVKDASMPEGAEEPAPKGLGFVALMVLVLMAMAWVVVGAKAWYVQLVLGAIGATAIMTIAQMLVNRGIVQTRTPLAQAGGGESASLSPEDRNKLKVVGVMLLFSITFWFVFQQAGSTLNLFAKDYIRRVVNNPEAAQVQVDIANLGNAFQPVKAQRDSLETAILRDGSEALKAAKSKSPAERPADLALAAPEREQLAKWDELTARKGDYDRQVKALDDRKARLIREKGGFEIPATYFQSVNAVLIVALGPLFVWIWRKRAGLFPSSPVKFAIGLLMASLGFFLLAPAAHTVQSVPGTITPVNMSWLVGVYFIHTLGELSLSPVGLSYVSKLAPKHLTSQLMGAWFFSLGIGAYLAGKAAGFMDSVPLWQIFTFGAVAALAMSLLLWVVVSRIIHKMMGGYS